MKLSKSQAVLLEFFFNTSAQEYRTILLLPLRTRIKAVLGLVCLYSVSIILIHIVIRPYLHEGKEAILRLLLIYGLFFLGFLSVYILTILTPHLERHFNKLFWLSILFALAGGLLLGLDLGILFTEKSRAILTQSTIEVSKSHIFAEVPDFGSVIVLLFGYSLLFLGIRLYGNTLFNVNQQKAEAETEIQLARKIHNAIIADIDMENAYLSAYGKIIPAKEVGGDYIELKMIDDQRAVMAIGDVSGHDVGSGLLMGMAKSAFHTDLKYSSDIDQIMASLNQTVFLNSRSDMFISFLSAIFDFDTKQVYITNAGHFPLLVRRSKSNLIEQAKPAGLVLGVLADSKYEVESITFNHGDIFVGFTDGMIEARDANKEEFGMERLISAIEQMDPGLSAGSIYSSLLETCNNFSDDEALQDDLSLLVVKIH